MSTSQLRKSARLQAKATGKTDDDINPNGKRNVGARFQKDKRC